ncbi:MAG: hypothetical protein HY560_13435 [Gemmatimonadetes bacterium]|nr:hypothetical protein [Gemmatimonadota bacterium]
MLELAPARAAVVRCFGQPRALDAFPTAGAALGRVAPDELWLIGPAQTKAELTQRAQSYLAGADPDGLVVEQSDGWSAWTVSGDDATAVVSRLSSMALPSDRPAFLQGALAHVPAKVLLLSDRLHLLVPAPLGHHLPERVKQACEDLGVALGAARELAVEKTP